MIVIIVVSVALLGLIASIAFGLSASEHAEQMTQATNHARKAVSLLRDNATAFDAIARGTFNGLGQTDFAALPAPLDSLPNNANMKMDVQMLEGVGAGGDYKDDIARIQVQVFWTIKGNEKHVELVAFQRRP